MLVSVFQKTLSDAKKLLNFHLSYVIVDKLYFEYYLSERID